MTKQLILHIDNMVLCSLVIHKNGFLFFQSLFFLFALKLNCCVFCEQVFLLMDSMHRLENAYPAGLYSRSNFSRFLWTDYNYFDGEHTTVCLILESRGGGTHDIFGRGCATIKSLYRPFLEFLTKKLDPFRNFCA